VIEAVRSLAVARGEGAFLVGGAVRDLILGRPTADLDVVVEGDAAEIAEKLAAGTGARPRVHSRFGTASVELPGGVRVDVARPRRETYRHPGALPDVIFPATLEQDLARRDFAIHAMALPLAGRGGLIDPFGGAADLAQRRIRILHDRSFVDDPTRACRAARYAARLGFALERTTARLIRRAVAAGAFDPVSGDRLRRELSLIVSEPARERSAALVARLGVDRAISAALARPGAPARLRDAAAAADRLGIESLDPLCYLLAWMGDAPGDSLVRTADRLALAGPVRRAWLGWEEDRERGRGIARSSPADRARRARGVSRHAAAAVAATLSRSDREAWLRAVSAPRPRLTIRGRDLLAAGVPPGPRVGAALARTLEARESGRIGPDEELEFALEAARGAQEEDGA
jgi:tRNA nucleotidyltransferase (CCA-adding enzyme)